MERTAAREDRHIRELDDKQSWDLFNDAAEHYLGISGREFLDRWESGFYEHPDQPEIMSVLMLLPFADTNNPTS
jgi:hypothetical protein